MKKIRLVLLTSLVMIFAVFCGGMDRYQPEHVVFAAKKDSIRISKTKATMYVGEKLTLSLKESSGKVTWTSSKTKVAKVNSKGVVIALKAGSTTITAVHKEKEYTCKIVVKKPSESVESEKELTPKDVYEKCCNSVVEVHAGDALGSGFFISENRVVTNYHVIDEATSLKVMKMDGSEYDVTKVCGYSEAYDLAILEVSCVGVPMKMNSHGISMGEATYTIGSSLGLTNTFSDGIVTNKKRIFDGINFIQTNTAISQGNSGGPLINCYGEVMGVTTCYFVDGQNLNLAINISQLSKVDDNSPMEVADFINRTNTKVENNTIHDEGGTSPDFEAVLVFNDAKEKTNVCGILIGNIGNKEMVVGGDGFRSFVFVLPSGLQDRNMIKGLFYDIDKMMSIKKQIVPAGEIGVLTVLLQNYEYISEESAIIFYFTYDGVDYTAVVGGLGQVSVFKVDKDGRLLEE